MITEGPTASVLSKIGDRRKSRTYDYTASMQTLNWNSTLTATDDVSQIHENSQPLYLVMVISYLGKIVKTCYHDN